ncbi:MAG: hypothetical protein HY675_15560 [Chloroflexi bacterium]|nr:hypothetical protein [Chloroflexota bacterium]
MRMERALIDSQVAEAGGQTLWIDLRAFQTDGRLCQELFGNEAFRAWVEGSHQLHLFLDSLDECLLRISTLAVLLVDELRKYPLERLWIRIACRTADWPSVLENGLKHLWASDALQVYELAPLRELDVVEAARANALNYDAFLGEVARMEVAPLAIKPVTLQFLLNTYRKTGSFPQTQTDLYLDGCRLLCEETNDSRRASRLTGTLSGEQRLEVASRTAAITMFANRFAIWTAADRGDVPDEDVTNESLCGLAEVAHGNEFPVDEAAVRDAIATGLFSSRGPSRMGWAHQTYAEFLAARYLVQRGMTIPQIISLIRHPGDAEGKLIPQLHETSGWLATMVPDIFRQVMTFDPVVLLRSDVASADVQDRAALVENLLQLFEQDRQPDSLDDRSRYARLLHPGLVEQLRPYIRDTSKGIIVRRVAIDIAEACRLRALQEDIANVALDTAQPLPIRVKAARTTGRIGGDETRARLRILITNEGVDDPDDELKGCALQALWPGLMSTEELFSVLTLPKREALVGAYYIFVAVDLPKSTLSIKLTVALDWVANQRASHNLPIPFRKLISALMLKAWDQLESPGTLATFAKALLSRLEQFDWYFMDEEFARFCSGVDANDERRRRVLEALLPMLSDPTRGAVLLVHSPVLLIQRRDVSWLLDHLHNAESQPTKELLAQVINRVLDRCSFDQLDAVFLASQDDPILADAVGWRFKSVRLDSPEAQRMKTDYLEQQEWESGHRDRPVLHPKPSDQLARLLEVLEASNLEAWWQLNMVLMLEPDGSDSLPNDFDPDLATSPGWKAADASTRLRITEAARRYTMEWDPRTKEWLGTNTLHRPALAGYRALRLLLGEDKAFVSGLEADIWRRWAPIILTYPLLSGDEGDELDRELVRIAYDHAPSEIIETLVTTIDKENAALDHIFITRKVESCWDGRLASAILNKAKDSRLKPECMRSLLATLLDHNCAGAKSWAESLIALPLPAEGDARSRALVAARVLATSPASDGWPVVWRALQQEPAFGREVTLAVAYGAEDRAAKATRLLTESEAGDLYVWLAREFPHSEDPRFDDAHCIGPRESVAHWRDAILRNLQERGTESACETIRRIADQLPELTLLKWTLAEARAIARRQTWLPPSPKDILSLARNQRVRLVQSSEQLLELLLESLGHLESKLQGETPAAIDLWDYQVDTKAYRPKDEGRFSDKVKRHLDDDIRQRGVVVNREVVIRRGQGAAPGERTDILVQAIVNSPQGSVHDSVSVVLEAKGCWNSDLLGAMETQLVDRYLKDNQCQHGLYLVGWFNCLVWDDRDNRKAQAVSHSCRGLLQQQLDSQAAELSKGGVIVRALVVNASLR